MTDYGSFREPPCDPYNRLGGLGVPDYLADWQDQQDELADVEGSGKDSQLSAIRSCRASLPGASRASLAAVTPIAPGKPQRRSSGAAAPGPDDLPDLAA